MSAPRTSLSGTYPALGMDGVPRRRARLAGLLLSVAVAAALAAGGWGLISYLKVEAGPARIGEAVAAGDGLLRVDGVTPERMAPMQAGKFTASGMNMSAMGMDMAPEGQRRFSVGVTLASSGGGLDYSPEDFRVAGKGLKERAPVRNQLEAGTVPSGGAVSGSLLFQVPEAAKDLTLTFDGGTPVSLDLPPAGEDDGHSHGGGTDGHDH